MTKDCQKFSEEMVLHFKGKADHNKNEALTCYFLVIFCSLLSPIFVTLGEGVIWGKIIPSVLSLLAAASMSWIQLRKPQTLWIVYRDSQRRIEDALLKYRFHLEEYSDDDSDDERILLSAVRVICMDAHQKWMGIVPAPDLAKNISGVGG